jgi:two-component sensor histidine kinase
VIVTELVTNAYKYAYPPGQPGPIRVRFWEVAPTSIALRVEDEGVGMLPLANGRGTGLGQKVIRAMASGLGSEVDIDPEHRGTRVTIAFQV